MTTLVFRGLHPTDKAAGQRVLMNACLLALFALCQQVVFIHVGEWYLGELVLSRS